MMTMNFNKIKALFRTRPKSRKGGTELCVTLLLLAALIVAPSLVLGGPIDSLQPGEWYQVPNSRISSVLPNPVPPGDPATIIEAWSGGALDSTRSRLIVWGGGHNDYGGNEIYVFDVNALTWSRTWGPSPGIPPPYGSTCSNTYSDGNPVSRHTYGGLSYLPASDRFWINGGSRYCGGGAGGVDTWEYSFSTRTWTQRGNAPDGTLGNVAAYDAQTGHVFMRGYRNFMEYNPTTGAWTTKGEYGPGESSDAMTAAVDPNRRLFVEIGEGRLRVWNFNTFSYTEPAGTGCSSLKNAKAPGFSFDSSINKFVGWAGGSTVYSLDPTNWSCTAHAPTNNVTPSAPAGHGTYGRFQFIPAKNAYVVVNSIDSNVYFYKLSSGSGSSDLTPPASPTGLTAQ
jgi:hypothetical protein